MNFLFLNIKTKDVLLFGILNLSVGLFADMAFSQVCSPPDINVSSSQSCPTITQAGSINSITNSGSIGTSNVGITSSPPSGSNWTIGTITNNASGTITGAYFQNTLSNNQSISNIVNVINNAGSIAVTNTGEAFHVKIEGVSSNNISSIGVNTFVNSGRIISTGGGDGMYVGASSPLNSQGTGNSYTAYIGALTNSGTISGYYGFTVGVGSLGNHAGNTASAYIGTVNNNFLGTINGTDSNAIGLFGGNITTLNNAGSITGNGGSALYIANLSTVSTITNTGSIVGNGAGSYGVEVISGGSVGILNNLQGSGNVNSALTYTGKLPTNYNIIINSSSVFGRLAVTSGTGSTVFGISALSGVGPSMLGSYSHVFTGLSNTNLGLSGSVTSITATSNGYGYTLSEEGGTGIWDLVVLSAPPAPGPSTANTQQSLANTVQPLQGTMTFLNTTLANSFSYDCTEFGANNICISAGGRNTAVSAANGLNNTSALLIAAYRPHPNYRIGAYADQNLSVNNAGSTVNLGNNTPLVGVFGAWNQRLNGTGTEVRVSAAYGQKNATVTRSVVGSGSTASEAGNGSAPINSQGAQVTAKYGFGIVENVIVSPYIGVRYTQNNMNGYTETASSSITAPLTYSAINTNATTALVGVGTSYKIIPAATVFASAGVETDTNTNNGTYSATGVSGLTPINFNANPVKTRPTATVGAYYDVEKNQRIGITGIYRQEPYQAVQTTTVMATYTVGL